jgi:hypothetical protein
LQLDGPETSITVRDDLKINAQSVKQAEHVELAVTK